MYKFRKIIGQYDFPYHFKNIIIRYKKIGYDFPYHFKNIIIRYKKIGYNMYVLRQTTCLVVNLIKVNNFAYLFDCTTVGRASDGVAVLS